MMGKCKHENHVVRYFVTHQAAVWRPWTNYTKRCADCDATLSLGPANDDDPNVEVELRAALLARPDTDVTDFADSEWLGWNGDEQYVMCGELRNVFEDMPDKRFAGWEAGGLAVEIAGAVATHGASR